MCTKKAIQIVPDFRVKIQSTRPNGMAPRVSDKPFGT
jgi:hypothetical protein